MAGAASAWNKVSTTPAIDAAARPPCYRRRTGEADRGECYGGNRLRAEAEPQRFAAMRQQWQDWNATMLPDPANSGSFPDTAIDRY
jgi:hypothetical protein